MSPIKQLRPSRASSTFAAPMRCAWVAALVFANTAWAAPVVVTPGSVAKYVYLPKTATTGGGGSSTSSAEGASLAMNRVNFQTCLRATTTVPVPAGFTRGTIQYIAVAGGGGGGGGGGSSNRSSMSVGGAGLSGTAGGDTVLTIGATTITARGGGGGGGGGGGKHMSALPLPTGGAGGNSLGGIGGNGGGIRIFAQSPTDPTPPAPPGPPPVPDEVRTNWSYVLSSTPALGSNYQSTSATVNAAAPTRASLGYYYSSSYWGSNPMGFNPTIQIANHPSAGLSGSSSPQFAYGTDLRPLFALGLAATAPLGVSCPGPTIVGSPGRGGAHGEIYWHFAAAGGGDGGTGEVLAGEIKYTGGAINVTIGAGGVGGNGGAEGAGPNVHLDGYWAAGFVGRPGGNGAIGAVALRFISE